MKKITAYKLTIVVTCLILYGILMPGDDVPSIAIPGLDKIVHMGMFFTFTAVFSLEHLRLTRKLPSILPLLTGVFCFALSTELMQGAFTTSRACDPKDLVADMIGALLACLCWAIVSKYMPTFFEKLRDFGKNKKKLTS
ncbi:MAG: VanZ family protein [Cellulosilyticaceae bacterium]